MSLPIFQVDAFADKAFAGNPAAVVVLEEDRETSWMQSVAAEMNLSETAFVRRLKDQRFQLRWFTPVYEVDLCGHATVASAHVLWEFNYVKDRQQIRFESRSGELLVSSLGDEVELDFPVTVATAVEPPAGLFDSFRDSNGQVSFSYTGLNKFDYLLELSSESQLRDLQVDFARLADSKCRGVIVTAIADDQHDYDFVSRFFAPNAGVDEDPVTGSAHCSLAPYWANKLGRNSLVGYQASQRGGIVKVTLNDDRVLLRGQAVTVLKGELLV